MRQSISKFQDIETKKSVGTFCVVFFGKFETNIGLHNLLLSTELVLQFKYKTRETLLPNFGGHALEGKTRFYNYSLLCRRERRRKTFYKRKCNVTQVTV